MSSVKVRAALETALNGMSPLLITAWENAAFSPPAATTPYQQVNILFAEPENPTYGGSFYRERGILQVTLLYPLQSGPNAAEARAELIRSTFYRGANFINSGVTVTVEKTPEISPGIVDGGMWRVPVKIRFYANI